MIGRIALLVGLLVVPLLVLSGGHHFRTKTTRQRRLFWGTVLGHAAGLIVMLWFAMVPPIWWEGGAAWRAFLVHWSLLIGSITGALIALASGRSELSE